MRAGLALFVLVVNVVAIVSILGGRGSTGRKLKWCAAVVLLPVAGALAWLVAGRPVSARRLSARRRAPQ